MKITIELPDNGQCPGCIFRREDHPGSDFHWRCSRFNKTVSDIPVPECEAYKGVVPDLKALGLWKSSPDFR